MRFDRQDPEVALRSDNHPIGGLGPLFDAPVPFQRTSDTSRAAADSMYLEAARLRRRVLQAFRKAGMGGLTADQAAAAIGETVLATRPRCTELLQNGFLIDTGERRENTSKKKARVLRDAKATPSAPRLHGSNERSVSGVELDHR